MKYDFLSNSGSHEDHFQFVKSDDEVSLVFLDNTFQKNKRLRVSFDYYFVEKMDGYLSPTHIIKGSKLTIGATFFTGVELKRELIFECNFDGFVTDFRDGTLLLNERIITINTSAELCKKFIMHLKDLKTEEQEAKQDLKREPIPQTVQDKVWNRDGGLCVKCGSNVKLEFDHIIPFSKGGANTYRNLQLLCESCNRKKSNKIG